MDSIKGRQEQQYLLLQLLRCNPSSSRCNPAAVATQQLLPLVHPPVAPGVKDGCVGWLANDLE
jgi:hypothetical protein